MIVVGAEAARVEAAMATSRDLPVELVIGHLPRATAPQTDDSSLLSAARQKYVNGDFAGCLQSLGADSLLPQLLGAGRRELAARVLFWRVACRFGSGALPKATDEAREFAALGLEVPADAAEATPEVESLLGRAIKEAAGARKLTLARSTRRRCVRGVSLDGRSGACVTPCALEVLPGEHLIALDAEGYLPVTRAVTVHEPTKVKLEATPAPPEVAAAQWSARYGGSPWLYSEPSTRLLARAVAARRLVLSTSKARASCACAGPSPPTARCARKRNAPRAPAISTRSRGACCATSSLSGKVFEPAKPIYKRAAFWVPLALAVSAAVIAASIAADARPQHSHEGRILRLLVFLLLCARLQSAELRAARARRARRRPGTGSGGPAGFSCRAPCPCSDGSGGQCTCLLFERAADAARPSPLGLGLNPDFAGTHAMGSAIVDFLSLGPGPSDSNPYVVIARCTNAPCVPDRAPVLSARPDACRATSSTPTGRRRTACCSATSSRSCSHRARW